MKSILKNFVWVLVFSLTAYSQKNEIEEAQKELNNGNSVKALAVLLPVEYLINNAPDGYRIHFHFIKGSALLNLTNNDLNTFKNLSQAAMSFSDLILIENESGKIKYTPEALTAIVTIRKKLVSSANVDYVSENFSESSEKFYQAYLLDKSDTLQLFNAAVSYKKGNQNDFALKCFEELKEINYSGNVENYIAYSKTKLVDETFVSKEDRDLNVENGTHIRPSQEVHSKKAEIYKNIALIYMETGYKEKAMRAIALAIKLDPEDNSLAFMEANLYLQIKEYEYFDTLATAIIEKNPNNTELVSNLGMICQKEGYIGGAEYYFKKAIEIDPLYSAAYVNLSALMIEKGLVMTTEMNELRSAGTDKLNYEDLKFKRDQILKSVVPYLQKGVVLDPSNNSAKQLLASLNTVVNIQSRSIASDF